MARGPIAIAMNREKWLSVLEGIIDLRLDFWISQGGPFFTFEIDSLMFSAEMIECLRPKYIAAGWTSMDAKKSSDGRLMVELRNG